MTLAIMLFFFLVRFVIVAAIFAAFLSLAYYVGRKMKNFFRNLDWENPEEHRAYQRYAQQGKFPAWKDNVLMDYPKQQRTYQKNVRTIEIR